MGQRGLARPVPGHRVGQAVLRHQRGRARRSAARRHARTRDRSVRSRRGTEGARSHHAGRGALLGHPAPPPDAPAQGVRAGHRRERLQEPLRRGVPDQGEPAAPRRRRGVPLRQGIQLRPGSRLEARAAGGHGDDRGCAGAHDRLQRLQGRQLHRSRDPRDQARPHDHSGDREFRRAAAGAAARGQVPGAPAHRRARQAGERRRRTLARLRRREIQVRAVRQRDPRAGRYAARARDARLPGARALPSGQPAAGHPPRQGRDQRAGARVRRAQADGHRREVHRRRRRARRRLRRQRHELRIVDELHDQRVRERRRVPHRQRVQCPRDRAPGDRRASRGAQP